MDDIFTSKFGNLVKIQKIYQLPEIWRKCIKCQMALNMCQAAGNFLRHIYALSTQVDASQKSRRWQSKAQNRKNRKANGRGCPSKAQM